MNEMFNKLKAPRRNKTQQAQSLTQIKHKIRKQQIFSKAQYAVTLTATLATVFILVWSLISAPNAPHVKFMSAAGGDMDIKSIYKVENYSTEPIFAIDAWYYPDKMKMTDAEDKAFFSEIAQELKQSDKYKMKELPVAINDYLLIFKDDSKQYIQFWSTIVDDRKYEIVMDAKTKQYIELTGNQHKELLLLANQKGSFVFPLIKLVLFMLGLFLMMYLFNRFKLLGESTTEKLLRKPFLKALGMYVYYWVVQGTSLFLYGTIHGLFVISILMVPFIIGSWRSYGKSNYTTSLWTLPLLALFLVYVVIVIRL